MDFSSLKTSWWSMVGGSQWLVDFPWCIDWLTWRWNWNLIYWRSIEDWWTFVAFQSI